MLERQAGSIMRATLKGREIALMSARLQLCMFFDFQQARAVLSCLNTATSNQRHALYNGKPSL